MNVILFEDKQWQKFLPLVFTRPVGELRIGMLTIADKWRHALQTAVSHQTRAYLQPLFAADTAPQGYLVNARAFPTPYLQAAIEALQPGECLMQNNELIAGYYNTPEQVESKSFAVSKSIDDALLLQNVTDIFMKNAEALALDFDTLTKGAKSESLHASNIVLGNAQQVYIAAGAKVWASTLNTTDGPIFIDKDAEVMEGSHIRGPFYLGEHSQLKMASKVYGATTIGPHCKVGGEVSNSVLQGYSNKGHDGFIGNTLLGEWCNLGADTNTSNLKNNYSQVRIYDFATETMANTGLTFCGLIMGDHSKCSINTMFNTGTVVGVGANVFGGGFPPKHIPSFSWGGSEGFVEYNFDKMIATARQVYARRGILLSDTIEKMLLNVFEMTANDRLAPTQSQE
jgi:UDP-N-acetylglucosamine diphosphorylase/glucosamine-1-phosphate N-acetyltransferase